MRLIPLEEVLRMSAGELVMCTKGKIKLIGDYHQGTKDEMDENTGEQKKWSFQKVTVTDGKAEMVAKIWDRDKLPSDWKGKVLYLSSTESGNHRWNGVKLKEDEYKGKSTLIMNVSGAAQVDIAPPAGLDGNAAPAAAPATPTPAAAPATSAPAAPAPASAPVTAPPTTPAPATTPTAAADPSKERDVKISIFQRANLWLICRNMAEKAADHLKATVGIEMSADQKAAMVSSLFISGDRDRLHYDLPKTWVDLSDKAKSK